MKTIILLIFMSYTYFQIFNYMLQKENACLIDFLKHMLKFFENK